MAFLSLGLRRDDEIDSAEDRLNEDRLNEERLHVVEKADANGSNGNNATNGNGADGSKNGKKDHPPIQLLNLASARQPENSHKEQSSAPVVPPAIVDDVSKPTEVAAEMKSAGPSETSGAQPSASQSVVSQPENENWPEAGMQIIQSVLRNAQSRSNGASAEGGSGAAVKPQVKKQVSNVAPEVLSPVLEEIRKKLAEESGVEIAPAAEPARARTPVPPQAFVPPQTNLSPQVDLSQRTSSRERASAPVPSQIPTFATFKFGYVPGKGLLYSIIGHEAAMFAIFLLITYVLPNFREQRLIVGSLNPQDHVIFLPELGGGTEGEKSPGGGPSKPQEASAAPARASKGFAYPGAQAILSNPPNPTNAFQTVLHPLKVHAEQLKKLVPLPNIVQMAETRLPSELIAPKAALPQYHAPVKALKVKQDNNLRREAKFNVPVKAPELLAKADMPKLAAAEQPLPQAPKVEPKPEPKEQKKEAEKPSPAPIKVSAEKRAEKSEKEAAPLSQAQLAKMEMHGKSAEPLLSLSPAPLPTKASVPAGEARGRFAIAPGGKLNPNSVTPGKASGTPSESPATGQENSNAANATTELASNTGTGAGHNPAAGGGSGNSKQAMGGGSAGVGTGSGKTAGAGVGGAGNGNGRGNAGAGAGRSGKGAGTGAGAGSGAGTGSFPGISIQGGEGNEGTTEAHSFTVSPQTPYQMTIVATASSGGGLADYGVFENEHVYTVYIPMQRTPQEADPTWTLQYAVENSAADSGQLAAPTPLMREWPQIPAELEKEYAQQQIVISAILGTDGKLTHITTKQSPDPKVTVPVEKALAKWVFHPAQLDNKPVAVKILLGIPL